MQDTDLFQLALGRLEPMRHVLPLSEIVGALTPPGPVKQRQKKRQPQKANATRSTGIVPARPPQGRAKQVHRRAEGSRRACRPLDCAPCRAAHSVLLRALKTRRSSPRRAAMASPPWFLVGSHVTMKIAPRS